MSAVFSDHVVEMLECIRHGGGIRGITEQARAKTLVEKLIDPGGEKLVVFGFLPGSSRKALLIDVRNPVYLETQLRTSDKRSGS